MEPRTALFQLQHLCLSMALTESISMTVYLGLAAFLPFRFVNSACITTQEWDHAKYARPRLIIVWPVLVGTLVTCANLSTSYYSWQTLLVLSTHPAYFNSVVLTQLLKLESRINAKRVMLQRTVWGAMYMQATQ